LLVSSLGYFILFYLLLRYQKIKRVTINDELIVNYKNMNLIYDSNDKSSKGLLKEYIQSDDED